MTKTVLLTGATGFIAKHIALQLLEAGYAVRGTVRTASRGAEVAEAVRPHLSDASDLDTRLSFVTLDLTSDDGWEAAMGGVDVLMHTASPFPMSTPDNEDDLIRPAVDGTLRALKAAKTAAVNRVVLTSSNVAIMWSPLPAGETTYDETNWTNPDDPGVEAYAKSKTLAERAAWDFVANDAPDMKLTTVNPGFVLGPPLDANVGTSINVIERILRGKDPMLPDIGFTTVDVRDVAEMHVTVIDKPETYGQRILTADKFLKFTDLAKAIKDAYPKRRIPTRTAPNFLIKLLAKFDPAIKSVLPMLGRVDKTDNSRATAILGRGMRQAHKAAVSSAEFLIRNKLV